MSKFLNISTALFFAGQLFPWQSCFSYPLTIVGLKQSVILDNKQLQHLKQYTVEMDYNRAYPNQKMTYQVLKLCELLKQYHINPSSRLEFVALDKFSVLIPASKLMDCKEDDSIAYLAIEPAKKWPVLFNHTNTTAGPYAVIWTNPERSYISDEYWAWSVVKIIEHQSIDESIVIAAPTQIPQPIQARVLNGYQIYVSHCSSCHTINHIGKAELGPDLASPKSIFDYYPDDKQLKQFIRDPKSVRKIPNGRMSGSSYVGLNDADLDDLISYLKYVIQKP